MFAYSRYCGESKSDHAAADIAARYSRDNGATWFGEDEIIVRNQGGMNVMSVSLLRLKSGEIALFYLLKNSLADCRPVMRRSFDEGRTWSEPTTCITDEVAYYVLNNDRVIQLRDGRLLFAVAKHSLPDGKFDNTGVVVTYSSDDNGATWHRVSVARTDGNTPRRNRAWWSVLTGAFFSGFARMPDASTSAVRQIAAKHGANLRRLRSSLRFLPRASSGCRLAISSQYGTTMVRVQK